MRRVTMFYTIRSVTKKFDPSPVIVDRHGQLGLALCVTKLLRLRRALVSRPD